MNIRVIVLCGVIFVSGFIANAIAHDPFVGLPASISGSSGQPLFSMTNSGTGSTVEIKNTNRFPDSPTVQVEANGGAPAISAESKRSGTALEAIAQGTGPAANFRIDNSSNEAAVLQVSTNGTGPAAKFDGDVLVNGQNILSLVPVGAVLPYFGDPSTLPDSWALCDGRKINDPKSPLNGKPTPNLRSMFIRGADSSFPRGRVGGRDNAPSHSHYFSDRDSNVLFGRNSLNGKRGTQTAERASEWNGYALVYENDSHGHSGGDAYISGSTNSGGSSDNRPRFVSLEFIIRIK